ncbi:MAG: hypothetical protein ACLQU4_07080 [Limisphaerales bacterium]
MNIRLFANTGGRKAWFARPLKYLVCGSGFFVLLAWQVAAQTNPLVVSTVAGLANFGSADGIGSAAKFLLPTSVAVDGAGNVYVADADNDTIRKVTSAGVVTTLAGTAQTPGTNDSPGSAALFYHPLGVAVDNAGNVYVADSYNHTIREITSSGVVSTIAGQPGIPGSSGGSARGGAQFRYPYGVAVDGWSNIFVADTGNSLIREITNGNVMTIGGSASPAFSYPYGVATDSAGNVYVADTFNFLIRRITPLGVVSTMGGSASPGFSYPTGVAVDSATNVYVADYDNQIIRVITPGGVVSTLAGELGLYGDGDGVYPQAAFHFPWGVAVDSATNVYVGDSGNGNIRKITRPSDVLSTLAGPDESQGVEGPVDSPAVIPRFNQPNGVAVDGASNLYVADTANNCIREVTPTGLVSTLAGSVNGVGGTNNGLNNNAEFYYPSGLCVDAATNIYVADYYNSTVRKIAPTNNGGWVTATIAGQAGVYTFVNSTNGANATFDGPYAVALDGATNLYVTDLGNMAVRKLTPSGTNWAVTTYASGQFNNPRGIAVDSSTNVYVVDSSNNLVYRIAPGGAATPFATSGDGLYNSPKGVAVDSAGNVYVANTGANTILGIPRGGGLTTNIAGANGLTGSADGLGAAAQFDSPIGLAVDAASNVYVADSLNNTIRKGTPDTAQTVVLTLTTSPDGLPLQVNGANYAYTPQVFALATNSTNTVTAAATNGYLFADWTQGGTVVSMSSGYPFTLSSNEAVVANFVAAALPLLSISQSNGVTFLYWTNSGASFALESATNLNPAVWAVVTNATNLSGGVFTVSNTWPDQKRFFQLKSR